MKRFTAKDLLIAVLFACFASNAVAVYQWDQFPSSVQDVHQLSSVTADPCGDTVLYPAGTVFYNSTSGYVCFCNNSNADIKTVDDTTACF